MHTHRLLALTGLLIILAPSSLAWAERGEGDGVSLDEAGRRAQGMDRRVMSARTVDQEGRRVHVIRALTPEGRVRRFEVDAGRDGPREREHPWERGGDR